MGTKDLSLDKVESSDRIDTSSLNIDSDIAEYKNFTKTKTLSKTIEAIQEMDHENDENDNIIEDGRITNLYLGRLLILEKGLMSFAFMSMGLSIIEVFIKI